MIKDRHLFGYLAAAPVKEEAVKAADNSKNVLDTAK